MKDVCEVLHQKEAALARVRRQVDSLRVAAPLLAEGDAENQKPAETAISPPSHAEPRGTDAD
jgi:hypothetical protein